MPQGFQAFTTRFTGRSDRIITDLRVSAGFDPASPPPTIPPLVPTFGLWDTGATKSVISVDLVQALNLTAVGATNVNHAGGMSMSPTYVVNFVLPNAVGVAGLLVTEFPGTPQLGAIVGMDVISQGDLALTNVNGLTCMSFRMPSCETVDYVQEANRITQRMTGRNDPCPCGTRKQDGSPVKFKHCHGR